jgi:hypothetical protein
LAAMISISAAVCHSVRCRTASRCMSQKSGGAAAFSVGACLEPPPWQAISPSEQRGQL